MYTMMRIARTVGVGVLSLLLFSAPAYPWGMATHAYIGDQLNGRSGARNWNAIYGSMSPDLFNFLPGSPDLPNLYLQTHYKFMNLWAHARTARAKALAYGFASHNDVWGADSTAHHGGRTFGLADGYVTAKAKQLAETHPFPAHLGIPDDVAGDLYHTLVEAAIDILVKDLDPQIGQTMTAAALERTWEYPYLLSRSFAPDLAIYYGSDDEARRVIFSAEKEFRKTAILYGQALMRDRTTAVELVAEHLVDLARSSLEPSNVVLPDSVVVHQLIVMYLQAAIDLCKGIDGVEFALEIKATINHVDQQLTLNGITR